MDELLTHTQKETTKQSFDFVFLKFANHIVRHLIFSGLPFDFVRMGQKFIAVCRAVIELVLASCVEWKKLFTAH